MWASNLQVSGGIVPTFTNLPRFDSQIEPLASIALLPGSRQQPDQRADNLLKQLTDLTGSQKENPLSEQQLNGIMHDFNNLLGMILSNAQLALFKLPVDFPDRQPLERVVRTTRRAAELSGQLVALLKGRKIEVALLDFNDLVAESIDLLVPKLHSRLEVIQNLAPDLELVLGNDIQFRQVLMNLLLNAIDAIGQASGRISVNTRNLYAPETRYPDTHTLPPGNYICLQVSDSGVGIDQGTLGHIFEPYFTTKRTGTGIGLHMTLAIVHAHRGAMQVFSTPGRGATFQVFLPTDSPDDFF
jgi:two-component system, cell cycle sensor histidine kinase and response regulator CckA